MTPRLEKDNNLDEHEFDAFNSAPIIKAKPTKNDATILVDDILLGVA